MDELTTYRLSLAVLFLSGNGPRCALTAFFYGFRDREKILDIFEETCGGRLIMNYNTIGGVQADLHPELPEAGERVHPLPAWNHPRVSPGIHRQHYRPATSERRRSAEPLKTLSAFGATGGTGRASGWACDVRKRHTLRSIRQSRFQRNRLYRRRLLGTLHGAYG